MREQALRNLLRARFLIPARRLFPRCARFASCLCGMSVCLLLLSLDAHAQALTPEAIRGADLDVAVVTFGPGEEVWERFGHNAIEIHDRSAGTTRWYNYGMFDFAQANFFRNFARGLMTYRIAVGEAAEELPVYLAEGRWVVRQELDLVPEQRGKLAAFLDWNARPEKAQYRYDYFEANCSTRVRDAIDKVLDGAIRAQTIAPSRGFTYRMDADRLMRPNLPLMLLIDAGLGPFADRRLSYWDESFVPMEFMRHLRDIRIADAGTGATHSLVRSESIIAHARLPEPPDFAPRWIWPALALGIGAAFVLFALARLRRQAWARYAFALGTSATTLVLGCAGLLLAALWLFTDHRAAWRNENLLLFDPLCLGLLPTWWASRCASWRPSTSALYLAGVIALLAAFAWFAKVLPGFVQDNAAWIAFIFPLHFISVLILFRRRH